MSELTAAIVRKYATYEEGENYARLADELSAAKDANGAPLDVDFTRQLIWDWGHDIHPPRTDKLVQLFFRAVGRPCIFARDMLTAIAGSQPGDCADGTVVVQAEPPKQV